MGDLWTSCLVLLYLFVQRSLGLKMAPSEKNIDDFCRLCAVEAKNGLIIYSTEGLGLCLEEKIIQCLRIEVSKDDMLPKKVCQPCHVRLEDTHSFAEQASRVQHTLELLVQMKSRSTQSFLEKEEKSYNGFDLKLESNVHMEDDIEDFPLHVSIESDTENCLESKPAECSEGEQSETEMPPSTSSYKPPSKLKGEKSAKSNCRRKMLQTQKKTSKSPKRRKRRDPPPLPSSDLDREENFERNEMETNADDPEDDNTCVKNENEGEDYQSAVDEENVLSDLNIDPSILEEEARDDEEDDEEADKDAKEEWKTHWGIKCNQCDQIFPFRSQFDKHYQNTYHKTPIYTCSYCNKTMEKYSTFRSHCYRHVTEGRYRCDICEKGFSLRSMLHVHILAKHTTVKPFICEECGKGFVTRAGLNIHLKKHKTDEKTEYPCSDCGKILHTRGGLTAHQNVHRLGRRFMCDVCGKTFTQKVNMQQHVKHHTGERPFACEKCGKCFAEKSHLNRHYSFHSEKRPYQCSVCHKMYKTERCLKVHAMVHAEARPYVCTYCNKGFLSTTKLKQHYNIHTGERPYACRFCERTFTNYPNWLKHTRRRHKSDPRSGTTPLRDCAQHAATQQHQQLQQAAQHQPHVQNLPSEVQVHEVHEITQEEGRLSVSAPLQQPDAPPHLLGACLAADGNAASMGMFVQYPQNHELLPEPLPGSQAQQPHPMHETHSQAMSQQSIPLSQVYPEHMMSMHMSHHQILPL